LVEAGSQGLQMLAHQAFDCGQLSRVKPFGLVPVRDR
jgi:hypothetical protein